VYLIAGVAGASGSVSDAVVAMLRAHGEQVRVLVGRGDTSADRFRDIGAGVRVGELCSAADVVEALRDVKRMFFNPRVSSNYLQETAVVCAAAREQSGLEMVVNLSQMTVAQMTLASTEESRTQWLYWLAEQVLNWSRIPVVHVRPTVLLDNPLFTVLARRSVSERGVLALPLGGGRTSPIAADDVARVVTDLLLAPPTAGQIYHLTGPQVLDLEELAEQYSRALGRTVTAENIAHDDWVRRYLRRSGLDDLVQQHLATVVRLQRENRYDRFTHDVERVTGRPPQSVEQYVASHSELFA
jgi:uncharacterized protein YbjT (DUF2867 family)